jgi:hypothetical protein
MLNLRNLIVALALVPAIAACSAGGSNNMLPAAPAAQATQADVNVDAGSTVNPDIALTDNYVDEHQDESSVRNAEFTEVACAAGLTCVRSTVLRPLAVRPSFAGYAVVQSTAPTQVKITRTTVMSIVGQTLRTNSTCGSTCTIIALPMSKPPAALVAGFMEGVTKESGAQVPILVTHRTIAPGTYYLFLAHQ